MRNPTGTYHWRAVLIGALALYPAQALADNTKYGTYALSHVTTGTDNAAFGHGAAFETTTGYSNTAVGRGAMYENINGYENTALGTNALYGATESDENVAVGANSLMSLIGAYHGNTAVGSGAMTSTTTGQANTAVGRGAMGVNTAGGFNVAVGYLSLDSNTSGNNNVAVGTDALSINTTGSANVAVGLAAGPTSGGLINTGAFGYGAAPSASYTIRIGNSSITSIGGQVAWSNLSDARFKTRIRENVPGLEFIKKLRPVTFQWDRAKLNSFHAGRQSEAEEAASREEKAHTGFLAQEVEAAAAACGFEFSGVVTPANDQSQYQLAYAEFVVPLVKAVQEQQKEIDALRATSGAGHAGALGSWSGPIGNLASAVLGAVLAAFVLARTRGGGSARVHRGLGLSPAR